MPVSGNEEQPGVLSWPLLDISAGIPLKKRRLLLVPPPSPPRHEAQSSPSKETDNGKKIDDEAQSSPCKETDEVKKIDGSVSDLKNEDSLSDLKTPEQSNIPESVPTVTKIGGDDQSESLNPEESGSEVTGKESALDMKNKHVIDSDQGPLSSSPPENTPELSEARPVDSLEVETKSLLTEEYAAPDVPLNTLGFPLADHDGKIQYKQDLMVQNNEGSSSGHGKSDASLLSLSLSKGTCSMETKATDGGMGKGKGKGDLSPIRMNWDLNTPMDSWDGSDVDAAVPASKKASCMTTDPNSIPQFLNSTDSGGIFINKGKQLIGTEEHTSKHSSCPIASVQGNHELEDSLRLTLGVASQGIKIDKRLSAEEASRKYVLDSSLPIAARSTASAGSIGFGIVKPEPSGDNSNKTSVQPIGPLRGFVDSCSVKRESTGRPGKESSAGLSTSITEKLSGQTSIKAEPVVEDRGELPQVDDVALQHGLLKIGRFPYGGSSSGLSAPLSPQKSQPSTLATSSALSASIGISYQSEFTFQINDIQASNCNSVQAAAKVHERAQKLSETEASGHEMVAVKSDVKFSKNSEISQLKISKNHNNMRVTGEGSVSDEEKLNISVETTEYEGYGSDYESEGNQGSAFRSNTQNTCTREEDDFEDGEVREAQAHLHTGDANVDTLGTVCLKPVNSDANSSVCVDGEIGNNMNDNTLGNTGDRTVDNIKECVDMASVGIYERLTYQDANLTKKLSDGIAAVATNDKLVDTSQINPFDQSGKGMIPDVKENGTVCDEPASACNTTVETMGEATDDNVYSDGMGNKLDSSPSKVDATLKRDGACIESTNGGNKSRIITLPRTSVTSLFETKSFTSNSLSSRSGREREEFGSDGRHGFIRDRFQEPHFRNPRNNYMRGRGGRFAGRMGNPRVEWDSEREFPGRSSTDTRHFYRNKCSAYNDMEMESSNYPMARDGSPLNTSRGRKPVKDLPSFHHPFSRRQSPGGGRDDPPTRDMQMLHKVPRNSSPGRRNNDVHGADFVGVRNEKFSRPFRNDNINSSYNRSNSGYEDGDGQFVRGRGARNFSTGQHRFFPRVRSKSPIGSRTHSPGGQWSPRRRSPDRFKVLPKVVQRRPAPLYGADRMSSPDRPCFPEDIVARRHGSPSYVGRATNNDPRDVDSGNEHGHPRPFNSRRSPSDRVFSRGSGRPDVMGPRIRECDDDFFSRPQSGGFREVNGEGSSNDDRRKCGERISFRPPYNADNDNRRFHVNDGPRSFRFRSDGDNNEYTGRNMGDNREFDGRIKNRPAVAPRRMNY